MMGPESVRQTIKNRKKGGELPCKRGKKIAEALLDYKDLVQELTSKIQENRKRV